MLGTRISHYRLKALLGEGAHGTVYRGVHAHDDDFQVAVKDTGDTGDTGTPPNDPKNLHCGCSHGAAVVLLP